MVLTSRLFVAQIIMLDHFVEQLANTAVSGPVYNQYAPSQAANTARRRSLRRYLSQMWSRAPTVMLVAEAPGYRGARLSGVPFASRRRLREGVAGAFPAAPPPSLSHRNHYRRR